MREDIDILNYNLLEDFVYQSKCILKNNLVGIYLHGSAAMGCFHEKTSDIDLLVVVQWELEDKVKHQYMDMVVALNEQAPAKGLELSIVREDVCKPFIYPTPFELHFSIAHLNWYQSNPEEYIEKMKGTDKDLAAHITILYHRGKTLYGKAVKEVFGRVSSEEYFDSIWCDIKDAAEEIADNPVYIILNLCRVLAYKRNGYVLSKQEGGEWGLVNVPEKYRNLISEAMEAYKAGGFMYFEKSFAKEYVQYMIAQIQIKI